MPSILTQITPDCNIIDVIYRPSSSVPRLQYVDGYKRVAQTSIQASSLISQCSSFISLHQSTIMFIFVSFFLAFCYRICILNIPIHSHCHSLQSLWMIKMPLLEIVQVGKYLGIICVFDNTIFHL